MWKEAVSFLSCFVALCPFLDKTLKLLCLKKAIAILLIFMRNSTLSLFVTNSNESK